MPESLHELDDTTTLGGFALDRASRRVVQGLRRRAKWKAITWKRIREYSTGSRNSGRIASTRRITRRSERRISCRLSRLRNTPIGLTDKSQDPSCSWGSGPNWASNDEVIDVFLSLGFRDAITEGRGLLHVGWAPQRKFSDIHQLGDSISRRKRNEEDGSFRGNDIAMSLREAMVSDEGEELRTRTRNVAAIFRDRKAHDSYVRNFVEYLKSNGEMKV
ncbi:hypothetical protein HAX54_000292 [Datura stramonium]|uniref:Uncharacterized protein n=1 Tax=Datura stramonium TaxID=4076 RepID=A0ABS8T1W6_DATST|nr:hypothetical protein [Datura stramonium]